MSFGVMQIVCLESMLHEIICQCAFLLWTLCVMEIVCYGEFVLWRLYVMKFQLYVMETVYNGDCITETVLCVMALH